MKKHLGAEPEAETFSLAVSLQSRQRPEYQWAAPGPEVIPQTQVVSTPTKHHDRPSVAVLPFQNLSGDAEQEYFADGIVEDITIALAQFRHLYVIARNSSFTYKGRPLISSRSGAS